MKICGFDISTILRLRFDVQIGLCRKYIGIIENKDKI